MNIPPSTSTGFSAPKPPRHPGPQPRTQQPATAPDPALGARLSRAPARPEATAAAQELEGTAASASADPPSVVERRVARLKHPVIEPGDPALMLRLEQISSTWSDIRAAVLASDLNMARSLAAGIGVPDLQVGSPNLSDYYHKELNHLRRIVKGEEGRLRAGSNDPKVRVVGFALPPASGGAAAEPDRRAGG